MGNSRYQVFVERRHERKKFVMEKRCHESALWGQCRVDPTRVLSPAPLVHRFWKPRQLRNFSSAIFIRYEIRVKLKPDRDLLSFHFDIWHVVQRTTIFFSSGIIFTFVVRVGTIRIINLFVHPLFVAYFFPSVPSLKIDPPPRHCTARRLHGVTEFVCCAPSTRLPIAFMNAFFSPLVYETFLPSE